jgi:hypothetical protein
MQTGAPDLALRAVPVQRLRSLNPNPQRCQAGAVERQALAFPLLGAFSLALPYTAAALPFPPSIHPSIPPQQRTAPPTHNSDNKYHQAVDINLRLHSCWSVHAMMMMMIHGEVVRLN